MISRVTSSSVNSSLVNNISLNYANYSKLTEQLSTGDKINSILDDTTQSINLISSNRELNKIGTWSANVKVLNNEIKESSDTIDLALEKIQRGKDLATNAATGTTTKDSLESTLTELDQIILGIVDMANTNYNNNYIYGGTNTKNPPYTVEYGIDATGNKTDEIIGVKYNGTTMDKDWKRELEIADGIFQNCNVTGIEAFGEYDKEPIYEADGITPVLDADGKPTYQVNSSSGAIGNLLELKNEIKNNIDKITIQENLPSTATEAEKVTAGQDIKDAYKNINGLIDNFSLSIDGMTNINSRFGTITNKLDMSTESLTSSQDNLKEFIAGIKELDVTKAISEWYSSQYAYQASMQASTSIMSMSLLNYI